MERLRLILLGLAGLVIVGLVLQEHYPSLRPVQALALTAGAGAGVASAVPVSYLADPDTSAYFSALKDALPQEYQGIVRQISSVHDAVAPVGAPDALAFAMRRLREDYGVLAGRAPIDNLDRITDAQRAILAALAGISPAACVDFYEGRPSAALTSFTSSHNALMLALANADLAAISAGRGQSDVPAQPTATDFAALTKALQKAGLDAAMIGLLVDGKMPANKPSDDVLCGAVGKYLGAVRSLATDIRLRLIARSVILAAAS